MGLPARRKLRDSKRYQQAFKRGRRSSDRCFMVLAIDNGNGLPRLGLAIGKKHLPRAVDRNRVKRIVRESFRHADNALKGLDIVVVARRETRSLGNTELYASLERHWRRLGRGT